MASKKHFWKLILVSIVFFLFLDGLVTAYKFREVNGSVKVFSSEGVLIYESINGLEGYQTPVKIEDISKYTIDAIVAAEDERFYKHIGIDLIAIARASLSNIKSRGIVAGGSTLTQQVAKQTLLNPTKNIYLRKIREINSALYLDLLYSKNEILEKYLSEVYFGNNSYGIEAAARTYFNKPASALSLSESAVLAGSIKSPVILNPENKEAAQERRNEVLDLMYEKGFLSENVWLQSKSYPLGLNRFVRTNDYMHFVEYALQEALARLDFDNLNHLQGYEIHTTFSKPIADKSLSVAKSQISSLKDKHKLSNAAVVVLDVENSAILAMLGSIDYFDEEIDGAVNVAISPRQPGSALKPFTYGQAFYEGLLTDTDIIQDVKTTFVDKGGNSYVPYNYNGEFNGEVSVRTALASSLNVPAVKVLDLVGIEDMISATKRAGIKTLKEPDKYDLSVTLGGGEVSLIDLTNAYNSLAREGVYMDTFAVERIVNPEGATVYVHENGNTTDVWFEKSSSVANMLTSILSDASAKVLGFGRNNVLNLPFSAASKTGTTTDWHDNWTLGYTDTYTVGVWVGNSDNTSMYEIDGVTGAGPIWREIMMYCEDNISKEPSSTKEPNAVVTSENDQSVEEVVLTITNPAQNGEYYANPDKLVYEKIAFEVSSNADVHTVEYIMDGTKISISGKEETNHRHLWTPEKGTHILEAFFYNSEGKIIAKDSAAFTVY